MFNDILKGLFNVAVGIETLHRRMTHELDRIWKEEGTMLQTGRSPVQVPDKVDIFNPSNRTMALGSIQPLIEMSTRNPSGGKKRPARRADNLTAICEPIV
jgi:hypothetical protein